MDENKCQGFRHLKWYYISAIPAWFLIFGGLFGFDSFFNIYIPYLLCHVLCLSILSLNIWQHWGAYEPGDYLTEETVYEYVERNTYYLIMAITIFLLISVNRDSELFGPINFNLVIYSQACAIGFCVLVLALVWMSTKGGKECRLVHLRHIKTVLFTYALSLFFITPVEIVLKLRGAF